MALAKGTNSYATVSEADAYFEDRLDVAAWVVATPQQREQALVTATSMLDQLTWLGAPRSFDQPLAFPRQGLYFDSRSQQNRVFLEEVPKGVIHATFELAYHLLNNDGLLDDNGSVESISLGGISLSNIRAPSKFPYLIRRGLKDFLMNGTGQSGRFWWRAN